ncbi:MAG: putative porin [Candidatus Omnitrophica bacterium]|nr:putative porin [Candidatus Omnitrophota bacterium]
MKRLLIAVLLGTFCLMSAGVRVSYAGEIDLLLQKLVDKGVLTGAEAQQVKLETQEQVKKEIAQGKYSSLPAWVQNIKLKGDLRLRYQNQHEKNNADIQKDANIGRVRMRLGLEAKVNDKILAGVGIATGSGDPRSTNISFGGYNSKKTVVLDYAYGKYAPLPWLKLVGGKMLPGDVFWEPTDLIWDTDITPEGAVIGLSKDLNPRTNLFMNGSFLVVETDSTSTSGASAFLIQPGASYKFNDTYSLKGAVSFSSFDVKDQVPSSHDKGSNTKYNSTSATTGNYAFNYAMLNPALEFKIMQPFKVFGLSPESLKFFGEYVNNLDVSKKNTGFSAGFQLGNEKIEKWGDWQLRYLYAMLGKDAVLDILPDSDRYSGKTGIRSHEVILNFGLAKNTSLGFDIYRSWGINGINSGGRAQPETLAQVDLNMKF